MTKKRTGGRVTPKGTQSTAAKRTEKPTGSNLPRSVPTRFDGSHGRQHAGPVGPTRSGHHRGNR